MNLSEVAALLEGKVDSNRGLLLDTPMFPELAAVLTAFGVHPLQVSEAQVAESSSAVTVDGQATLFGTKPGSIHLEVTGTDALTAKLSFTAPPGWSFADGFPGLPLSYKHLTDNPGLVGLGPSVLYDLSLASATLTATSGSPMLDFAGSLTDTSQFTFLATVLDIPAQPPLQGTIQVNDRAPATPDLAVGVGRSTLAIGSLLEFDDVGIRAYILPDDPATGMALTRLDLHATLMVGASDGVPVKLSAPFYPLAGVVALSADFGGAGLSISRGVQALAELLHLDLGEFSLPKPLDVLASFQLRKITCIASINPPDVQRVLVTVEPGQPWTIASGVEVDNLAVGWAVAFPFNADARSMSGSISGTLALGTVDPKLEFDVYASSGGGFVATGVLAHPMTLEQIATTVNGSPVPGLPQLDVIQASVTASTNGDFQLLVSLGNWPVASIGHTPIELYEVSALLGRAGGAVQGTFLAALGIGTARLTVSADLTMSGSAAGWVFTETAAATTPINLEDVVNLLLPAGIELPSELSELQIRNQTFSWNTQMNHLTFGGETDFSITLGPQTFKTVLTLNIDSAVDAQTGQRTTTGTLTGDLTFHDTDFKIVYAFHPTEKVLRGFWEATQGSLSYESLARAFGIELPQLPDAVPDLGLKRASFEFNYTTGAGETFIISADSSTFGEAFFLLKQTGDPPAWGFAFGVALPSGWKRLSQIPGKLGESLRPVDFLEFESAFLLLSSSEFPSLQLPDLPALAAQPMRVTAGLLCGAVIDFVKAGAGSNGNAASVKNLHGITGKDVLLLSVTLSPNPADIALTVDLEGSVVLKGEGGSQITLSEAAIVIRVDPLTITLRGSVEFPVGGQRVLATGFLTVSPTEAVAAFDVRAEDKYIPMPMGFRGVHLTEIGVEMGAVFEPPSVMLGLEGNFVIGETATPGVKPPPASRPLDAMPATDEFVFVFNATAEAVNPLLLSMYLAEVSLQTLITALLDHPVGGLPSVLTDIKASELMLYWCDAPPPTFAIQQPDGTMAFAGTGFNANLDLWGFHAHAALKIEPTKGFTGEAYMDPLHVAGVIDVVGDGKGTPDTYKGPTTVKPGGAIIQVSTLSSPYLDLNWKITLFGLASETVNAQVTRDGLTFDVEYKVGTVFDTALSCSLKRQGASVEFRMGFTFKLNVVIGPITIADVSLGTIDLTGTGFDAHVVASVGSEGLRLTIDGSFEFEGSPYTLPQINLTVAPRDIEALPKMIEQKIADEAQTIFKDLYDEARRYIEEGAQEAERLGQMTADEVAAIDQDAVGLVARITADTETLVSNIGADAEAYYQRVMADADALARDVYAEMQRVEQAYRDAAADVERLAKEAEAEAARAVHQVEEGARYLVNEAASLARGVANEAHTVVNTVGDAVKEGAKDVWNGVKKY